ncbi:hypothetical protein D9611_008030 [Ephemerocybe angulata]|uniref:DUF6533 domain-containing protein n=1 Tax=Ephemerocybe angulata TaxID=980116 RepID=A0A8H5BYW4_9AGAR|nr:hypothetical protein D9611_008030 [Tulosesus angulatus]
MVAPQIQKLFTASAWTLLVYDYALTFETEVATIWAASPWPLGRFGTPLFYLSRYFPLIDEAMLVYTGRSTDSARTCEGLYHTATCQIRDDSHTCTALGEVYLGQQTRVCNPPAAPEDAAKPCKISYSPTEVALTLAVVAGAIGYGYYTRTQAHTAAAAGASSSTSASTTTGGKKGKGKKKSTAEAKASEAPAPAGVVPFPAVIPGGFNDDSAAEDSAAASDAKKPSSKAKKGKKSAGKGTAKAAAAAEDGVSTPTPRTAPAGPVAIHPSLVAPAAQQQVDSSSEGPASTSKKSKKKSKAKSAAAKEKEKEVESSVVGLEFSTASIEPDTDGSWTRVEPRKAATSKSTTTSASASAPGSAGLSVPGDSTPTGTSGDSSPVRETFSRGGGGAGEKKKTLAEKKASKNRKTGVEDLLETPDYPTLARVMRIKPRPDEKPISGYSWGDYEDVAVPGTSVTDAGNHADREDGGTGSADGEEDEGGWGVVQSRKPKKQGERSSTPSQTSASASLSSSTELTKKQRQNQKKKEAEKAAKAALQSELQGAKAQHDRELLKIRMAEQAKERERAKGKVVGGGMQARVDEGGRLIWE